MPIYIYRARDATGKPVRGEMEAPGKNDIITKLNQIGYMTTYVAEAAAGMTLASMLERLKRVSADDLLLFYIQFSNMINAGIPILNSIHTIKDGIDNRNLRDTIAGVSRRIEGGEGLSQAFAGYSAIFPRPFVNMVKAGEASGKLDNVLLRYAQFFEHQQELYQKVKSALLYPAILLCAGIAVTLFIVTYIIPQFARIYMEAGVKLPLPTLIVYKMGLAVKGYWYILVLLALLIFAGMKYYMRTEKGVLFFDRLKLNLPIVGPLHRKAAISRFSRTLATLAGSGVPILESLDITRGIMGNEVLGRVIDNVHKCVERGERIATPLKVSNEFPQDVVQMVSVGEEAGRLDEMLNKIADFYDMSVGYAIKKLTTFIEPLFLVIMGIMIGFIMASMLMPIFDMIKTLRY